MQLVINSLGGGHTDTHAHTHTHYTHRRQNQFLETRRGLVCGRCMPGLIKTLQRLPAIYYVDFIDFKFFSTAHLNV